MLKRGRHLSEISLFIRHFRQFENFRETESSSLLLFQPNHTQPAMVAITITPSFGHTRPSKASVLHATQRSFASWSFPVLVYMYAAFIAWQLLDVHYKSSLLSLPANIKIKLSFLFFFFFNFQKKEENEIMSWWEVDLSRQAQPRKFGWEPVPDRCDRVGRLTW